VRSKITGSQLTLLHMNKKTLKYEYKTNRDRQAEEIRNSW